MISLFQKEIENIYLFLKRYKNEAIIISLSLLFLTLYRYNTVWKDWFSAFLYLAVLPVIVIVFLLRSNPLDFGFRLGNYRIWGFYVIITCLVAAPILYFVSRTPSFQSYYRIEHFNLTSYFLINCISLFAQEFIFRGFLLFGLREKLREGSIFIQMIPFVLVHLGKPELETVSTIITGIYFGYIAYRGKSYWPALIIHLFINIFFVTSVNLL